MVGLFANLNPCQIFSGANQRVIGSGKDPDTHQLITYVRDPNPTDTTQQWLCAEFFDSGYKGFALITMVQNVPYALSMLPGVTYPQLLTFSWDPSFIWQLGRGLSTVRDSAYCLTMEGAGGTSDPWPAGTKIQAYKWQQGYYQNQLWTINAII